MKKFFFALCALSAVATYAGIVVSDRCNEGQAGVACAAGPELVAEFPMERA